MNYWIVKFDCAPTLEWLSGFQYSHIGVAEWFSLLRHLSCWVFFSTPTLEWLSGFQYSHIGVAEWFSVLPRQSGWTVFSTLYLRCLVCLLPLGSSGRARSPEVKRRTVIKKEQYNWNWWRNHVNWSNGRSDVVSESWILKGNRKGFNMLKHLALYLSVPRRQYQIKMIPGFYMDLESQFVTPPLSQKRVIVQQLVNCCVEEIKRYILERDTRNHLSKDLLVRILKISTFELKNGFVFIW